MSMHRPASNHWFDPWLLTALVVGLSLRLFNLGTAALWHDEIYTVLWLRLPPLEMLRSVLADNHLPLYPLLLKGWVWLLTTLALAPPLLGAESAWLLRLPSALLSLAAVAAIAALAESLAGRRCARWAAWLAALSPYLIHHGQEARMYSLVVLLAALSLWRLARFASVKNGLPPPLGWFFCLSNVALLATHYYAIFLIVAELLVLLVLWRKPLIRWLPAAVCSLAGVLATLACALLLPSLVSGQRYELGLLALFGVVWGLLAGYTLMPSAEQLHQLGLSAVRPYLPPALAAIPAVAILCLTGLRRLSPPRRLLLAGVFGAILGGPFLAQTLQPSLSINPRYFATGLPLLLALLAAGMAQTKPYSRPFFAALAVTGLMLAATLLHLGQPGVKRADIDAAGAWLDANVDDEHLILVSSSEMMTLAAFHWPQRRLRLYPGAGVVADAANAAALVRRLPVLPEPRRPLIYVFGRDWLSDPDAALRQALAAEYALCPGLTGRGIDILCLRPNGRVR